MSESHDMDAPVTRRELHEALETWSGAIAARTAVQIETAIETAIERSEQRLLGAMKQLIEASEQRLMNELRSQTKGSEAELATRLVAVDQQYKGLPERVSQLEADLPPRVTRLEAKVFAPRKRGVATARRRKRS